MMAGGAALSEQLGTLRSGSGIHHEPCQDLDVGLAERRGERRHLEVAAALFDDLTQIVLGAAEGDCVAVARRALLCPESLSVRGSQEVSS